MRLEVEITDYSCFPLPPTCTRKVLSLAEAIALKAEVDANENKEVRINIPQEDVCGYLFDLGGISVLLQEQEVALDNIFKPVVQAYPEELGAALVYSIVGRFDSRSEEDQRWELYEKTYLDLNRPGGAKPTAGRYCGNFCLISSTPIPEEEVEAAKAEVERLWRLAKDKTLQVKEIFLKLSPEEQDFLRQNLRSGIAPED